MKKKGVILIQGVSTAGKHTVFKWPKIYKGYDIALATESFDITKAGLEERIVATLDSTISLVTLIEGYPMWETAIQKLEERFEDIRYILVYAPLFLLNERQKYLGTGRPSEDNYNYYANIINKNNLEKIQFVNTGEPLKIKTFNSIEQFKGEWEKINTKPTPLDQVEFVKSLGDTSNQYDDIELPGNTIKGVVPCQETWVLLKDMGIDFKDKCVVDVGCNEGFFLFKIKEAGASRCVGIEIHEKYIKNAKKIAWLKQCPVDFLQENIDDYTPRPRDITLCLNMLHYTDTTQSLHHLFSATKEIVFEINNEQVELVENYAKFIEFELVKKIPGRINRHILWFKVKG